jgi:nicotinamide phosphoribosyltransferase
MKATYGVVNGEGREIFKDPKTDQGKKSAKGLLRVDLNEEGVLSLFDQQTQLEASKGLLKTVYYNGVFDSGWLEENTIGKIRERLKNKA